MFDKLIADLAPLPLGHVIKRGHTRFQRVRYHTWQWSAVVEQGYTTATVEDGIALMIRDENTTEYQDRQFRALLRG